MKKIIVRVVLAVVILFILIIAGCWIFLGSIVTKGVNTVGPTITKTDVRLGGASVSIISGSATLNNLFVGNPEGYKTDSAIKANKIAVSLKPMSIFGDKIIVHSVNVEAPDITVEGGLTQNNLTKILDNTHGSAAQAETKKNEPEKQKKAPEEKAARKMEVDDFVISAAKVHYSGSLTGGKTVTVPIPDIHLQNLGTGPDGITAADLTKEVMNAVTAQVIPALTKEVGNIGKEATGLLKDATSGKGSSGLTNVTKGLKSLFGK